LHWIRFPRAGIGPLFLGWAEYHPVNEEEQHWAKVFSDTGGPATPTDKEYQGAEEIVAIDLQEYNDDVLDLLEAMPRPDVNFPGTTTRLDRGALLIANGLYFELWQQYSFFGTINAQPDLGPGWFFPCCNPAGIYRPKQGTKTRMSRVMVEANNIRTNLTSGYTLKLNTSQAFAPIAGLVPSI
jgi:hypothetical protein